MHSTNDHRTSIGSADTLQYRLLPWIYTSYISYHSSKIQYLASALAEYTQVKHSSYASSKAELNQYKILVVLSQSKLASHRLLCGGVHEYVISAVL